MIGLQPTICRAWSVDGVKSGGTMQLESIRGVDSEPVCAIRSCEFSMMECLHGGIMLYVASSRRVPV